MPAEVRAEEFESLRPLLFGIAYRMLGTVTDAQDVVQEAYIRYAEAVGEGTRIDSLKAYLAAVVTRIAIDHLRSARVRREEYVGLWLPEPLITEQGFVDPASGDDATDSLSMAFLLLLEKLNPVERAVFLLHEVFGFAHAEIGGMVGKSEANTRKIASRARQAVHASPRIEKPDWATGERLASRFFAAMRDGDVEGLVSLLAGNSVVFGDGGGKAPQWTTPIDGVERVSRLLAGVGKQIHEGGARIELLGMNGGHGAIVRAPDGRVISVFSLEIHGDKIHAVRSVINPDKLRHLGPVADVRALLRNQRSRSQAPNA